MISVKKRRGKIWIRLEEGQEIIIDSLSQIASTISMIEANEELDFQQARGIIDILSSMRQDMIRLREKKCIRESSSIPPSGPRGLT